MVVIVCNFGTKIQNISVVLVIVVDKNGRNSIAQ